jgi:hypothetical protein
MDASLIYSSEGLLVGRSPHRKRLLELSQAGLGYFAGCFSLASSASFSEESSRHYAGVLLLTTEI